MYHPIYFTKIDCSKNTKMLKATGFLPQNSKLQIIPTSNYKWWEEINALWHLSTLSVEQINLHVITKYKYQARLDLFVENNVIKRNLKYTKVKVNIQKFV